MTKDTKILITITVIVVILVAIVTWLTWPKTNKEITVPTQQKVIIPTMEVIDHSTKTGALYISPTESEYTEIELIANLRKRCPIDYGAFSIDYDYGKNKFEVVIKDKLDSNKQLFDKWMAEAGYDQISPQYFEIN